MTDTALRDLLAARVRTDVRLRLGERAVANLTAGELVLLSGREADDVAESALAALRDAGYTITPPPKPARRLRRAGSPWRLLVHEYLGNRDGGPKYGTSHNVSNTPVGGPASEFRRDHVLEGTEFDELVVGRWGSVHIEQMDTSVWWANFGGITINIRVDRDGRPRKVDVYGPGDYADAAPGAEYHLTWRGRQEVFTAPAEEAPS